MFFLRNKFTQIESFVTMGIFCTLVAIATGESQQFVEGFDQVEFSYNAIMGRTPRDFRGTARGYMTAGWWCPGQMKDNYVSWETDVVPEKKSTTFVFIGSSSVVPSEFSKVPSARLSINGKYALTFTLGVNRNFTWQEGDYRLKYISKRVEFPYFGLSRQGDLNGNSGIYHFSVPADAVEAGQSAILKVEILPFNRWHNGWFMVKERRDVLKQSMDSLEGEIEALRQDMAVMNEQMHILATQVYSKTLDTDKFEHEVIYANGYRHLHPADIVALQNGEILITCREATEHYANDGDVIMLRSKDGGKTWGDKQTIGGVKELDEREGCGIQLRDGTIVMGIFYNGLYNADGSYGLKTKKEPGKHYLGSYIIISQDDGRTWSRPNYIDTTEMPFESIEGPTDAPVEMPDGSIIMAVTGYQLEGDKKNKGSVLLNSTDKGKTWKYFSTIASDSDGKMGGFVEPGIVRTKAGRIIAAMRTPASGHSIYTTFSEDDGKTWRPVKKTPMRGHPVDLIQLSNGWVMATYGIRPPIHGQPGGIRACFSKDNGETWDIQNEVRLRNDFINWDIGYPESLQLPDGSILTVYYYNLFGRYFLGRTHWKP